VEEYREADKKVKNMMGTAKRNFEKRLANEKGSSNGPFYAYVKKRTKIRSTIGPLKDKESRTITDDKEMAELLNKFFSSVFTREDVQNVPSAAEMEAPSLETMDITYRMVQEKIRSLKPASAPGSDGIGPQLLQELQKELAPALVLIFRKSIQNGEVPEDWKCANVTPIFKKGSKSDPGNYRPVSLTSVCCKILESIIRDTVMEHLLENNLLNQSQHGFMPRKSCCTNLLEFFEAATKSVDAGNPFDVIFLDFAKAFDKVPRERLLEKIQAHGVRGNILAWIREWLTGRQQREC
jgi:hypothetical protein